MIVHVLCFLVGGSANGKRERREGEEGGRGEKKGKKGEKRRTNVFQLMYMHSHMRPLNLHGMAV